MPPVPSTPTISYRPIRRSAPSLRSPTIAPPLGCEGLSLPVSRSGTVGKEGASGMNFQRYNETGAGGESPRLLGEPDRHREQDGYWGPVQPRRVVAPLPYGR